MYAYADTGVLGLRDFVDHARHIAAHVEIPLLVDFDTGFGNAVNVWHAVQECVRCGAAALQIEDQEAPEKSGTLAGRRCISQAEAVGKIRAAIDARQAIDPESWCPRVSMHWVPKAKPGRRHWHAARPMSKKAAPIWCG